MGEEWETCVSTGRTYESTSFWAFINTASVNVLHIMAESKWTFAQNFYSDFHARTAGLNPCTCPVFSDLTSAHSAWIAS